VAEALPSLPFPDNAFDLALSSHFLFLYSEQLSADFHLAAVREMLRVAVEARFYPLLALDGSPSPHVQLVAAELRGDSCQVDFVPIDFEFQKGANQMLRIRRL
jgi:hypothetical protein